MLSEVRARSGDEGHHKALILSEVEGSWAVLPEVRQTLRRQGPMDGGAGLAGIQLSLDTCLRRCLRAGCEFWKPASSFDFAQDEAYLLRYGAQ